MTANIDMVARIAERLKTGAVGDLLTEDDLRDIVGRAITEAFFKPRKDPSATIYNSRSDLPPLIHEVVVEALKKQVDAEVQRWFARNADKVTTLWREIMDKGIEKYVYDIKAATIQAQMRDALRPYIDEINNMRGSQGLPYINL